MSKGANDLYSYYEGKLVGQDVDDTEHRDDYIDDISKFRPFNLFCFKACEETSRHIF